jgi:hypothetical protein
VWTHLRVTSVPGSFEWLSYYLSPCWYTDLVPRTPADFAVLKSIGKDAADADKKLVEVFSERDDVLLDFEFTPIHIAVLNLHGLEHCERPSLEEYVTRPLVRTR